MAADGAVFALRFDAILYWMIPNGKDRINQFLMDSADVSSPL